MDPTLHLLGTKYYMKYISLWTTHCLWYIALSNLDLVELCSVECSWLNHAWVDGLAFLKWDTWEENDWIEETLSNAFLLNLYVNVSCVSSSPGSATCFVLGSYIHLTSLYCCLYSGWFTSFLTHIGTWQHRLACQCSAMQTSHKLLTFFPTTRKGAIV